MDWLTFIDHMIGRLAWPLLVAGVAVFLSLRHRSAMDAFLRRVRKAKAGPFEAELAEAKAEAVSLPTPNEIASTQAPDKPAWFDYLYCVLTEVDPRSAVIWGYHYLHHAAFEIASQLGHHPTRLTDDSPAVMHAAAVGLVIPEHVDVLERLRDAAFSAHDPNQEVSTRQAEDYTFLVARMIATMLDRLYRVPRPGA
jgi:hypothetical protein